MPQTTGAIKVGKHKKAQDFLHTLHSTGYKEVPTTWAEYEKTAKMISLNGQMGIDAHCWVVNSDGLISDYNDDDKAYEDIRLLRGLKKGKIYKALEGEERKKAWAFSWKNLIAPRLKAMYEMNFGDIERANIISHLIANSGSCFIRAYILSLIKCNTDTIDTDGLKKVIKCNTFKELKALPQIQRIEIGSMGWKNKKDGRVWWEYG